MTRQEALDPTTKAKEQASVKNQLVATPSDGTRLTLTQESTSKAVIMSFGGAVPVIAIPTSSELKMMEVTPMTDEASPCHLWMGMTA